MFYVILFPSSSLWKFSTINAQDLFDKANSNIYYLNLEPSWQSFDWLAAGKVNFRVFKELIWMTVFYVNFFKWLLDWQLYVLSVYEIETKWNLGGFVNIAWAILNKII